MKGAYREAGDPGALGSGFSVLKQTPTSFSESVRWAAPPIVFGPRTLWRTWGTRPIPSAFVMTHTTWGLTIDQRLRRRVGSTGVG
jgi:hypothetical protein